MLVLLWRGPWLAVDYACVLSDCCVSVIQHDQWTARSHDVRDSWSSHGLYSQCSYAYIPNALVSFPVLLFNFYCHWYILPVSLSCVANGEMSMQLLISAWLKLLTVVCCVYGCFDLVCYVLYIFERHCCQWYFGQVAWSFCCSVHSAVMLMLVSSVKIFC